MFEAFDTMNASKACDLAPVSLDDSVNEAGLIAWLSGQANDLEPAAISLHPAIGDALAILRTMPGCKLARMSGSGATCFGLFSAADAAEAAHNLHNRHPDWWVRATTLSENLDANSNA